MNNRLTNILLLIIVIMGAYWFWKQPETRSDAERLRGAVEDLGDKTIDAAAKVTNKLEEGADKAKDSLERAADKTADKTEEVKRDFEDARARDRRENP